MSVNRILRILFLYNGIFVLASSLLGPLYALYVEKLYVGILPVSFSWAIFLFSTTVFTYILSKLGDGIKPKRFFLATGYVVRGICWLSMGFITSIEQLFVIQFVLGIGEALGTPSFDAIFAEHLDKNKHIMDYADWKVISNGVLVMGTLLGGLIVSEYGFQPLFVGMAALAGVSAIGIIYSPTIDSRNC